MMALRAILIWAVLTWAGQALAQNAFPEKPVPNGFKLEALPSGGMVLSTHLSGEIKSAKALAEGMIEVSKEYFDVQPLLGSRLINADDSGYEAIFSTSVGGEKVVGLLITQLQQGGGITQFIFDRPNNLSESLANAGLTSGAGGDQQQSACAQIPRQRFTAPDNSTSVTMPNNWQMLFGQKGAIDFVGPAGEGGSLGAGAPIISSQLQYMEPMQAYQSLPQYTPQGFQPQNIRESYTTQAIGMPAIFVLADGTLNGRPFTEFALVGTQNMGDQWLVYHSNIGAPTELFNREFRTMMEIWGSYGINPAYVQQTLKDALGKMSESSKIYEGQSGGMSDAVEQGNKGWSLAIKGNDIIENTADGQRIELPDNQLQEIVGGLNQQDGGNAWRVVPQGQY
jgi:hypothetical protein